MFQSRNAAQRGQGHGDRGDSTGTAPVATSAPTIPCRAPRAMPPQNSHKSRTSRGFARPDFPEEPIRSCWGGSLNLCWNLPHSPSFQGKGGSSRSSSKPCPRPRTSGSATSCRDVTSQPSPCDCHRGQPGSWVMAEDGERRDNGSRVTWIKISVLFTSVACPGKAGDGSHKFQGILSSSWGDRGWEGEGASTGTAMRNNGSEVNSQGEQGRALGWDVFEGVLGKSSCTPLLAGIS